MPSKGLPSSALQGPAPTDYGSPAALRHLQLAGCEPAYFFVEKAGPLPPQTLASDADVHSDTMARLEWLAALYAHAMAASGLHSAQPTLPHWQAQCVTESSQRQPPLAEPRDLVRSFATSAVSVTSR